VPVIQRGLLPCLLLWRDCLGSLCGLAAPMRGISTPYNPVTNTVESIVDGLFF